MVHNQPADLISVALEALVAASLELPVFSTLDRLVRRLRSEANRVIFDRVTAAMAAVERESLDRLLVVPPEVRKSAFQRLKDSAGRATWSALRSQLETDIHRWHPHTRPRPTPPSQQHDLPTVVTVSDSAATGVRSPSTAATTTRQRHPPPARCATRHRGTDPSSPGSSRAGGQAGALLAQPAPEVVPGATHPVPWAASTGREQMANNDNTRRRPAKRPDTRPWVVRNAWVVVSLGGAAALTALLIALLRPESFGTSTSPAAPTPTSIASSSSPPASALVGLSVKERADVRASGRDFWLKLAAGAGALAGALLAWGRFEMSKEQADLDRARLDSERFGQAVDQLGNSDKPDVVLGGLYALEALGDAPSNTRGEGIPSYQSQIIEVLSAYFREHTQDRSPDDDEAKAMLDARPWLLRALTAAEQSALTILARHPSWDGTVDLRGSGLSRAQLAGAHLRGAHLAFADLEGANLRGAYLNGANLAFAHVADAAREEHRNRIRR